MLIRLMVVLSVLLSLSAAARADYAGWQHSGSIFILTTPEGANLPASASVEGFPLLVRLDRQFFDFTQAKPHGEDIRFATAAGAPLPYQIEQWDPAAGTASIWVRIPTIKGNDRQEIKLYWGKADAASESSGPAVFNESNGYLSVWHLNDTVKDEVGTLESVDAGTTAGPGIIGGGRHFAAGQGIKCGEKITAYPTGAAPHSTEAWFRAERPNTDIVAWGNEHAQGKVVMQYRSPPHIQMDCFFSGANVASAGTIPIGQWVHVVHTYEKGNSRLYVNGVLDGVSMTADAPLAIKSPARMWIGGWYNNFSFVGDMDEVRVSKVARSADWVRLEYENQKPMQTLVGPVVQPGSAFSLSETKLVVPEGKSATVVAQAGGAQKLTWILKEKGRETIAAVNRFAFTFDAGRVVGDKSLTLQLKAVYPDGVRTKEIPVTIKEAIPEPVVSLKAPAQWDGRKRIEVVPRVANLAQMRAKGAGDLRYAWSTGDIAVSTAAQPGKLVLTRAQNSGKLTVALALSNGGTPTVATATILVNEPKRDPWVERTPAKEEMPEEGQFYARDDKNQGTLFCNGTLAQPADSVFLRVFADDKLYRSDIHKLPADRSYSFAVKLRPGLIKYRMEFGSVSAGRETVLHTAGNLVCGDAYIINGQSNAEAVDFGRASHPYSSDWIRSFGCTSGDAHAARLRLWGNAAGCAPGGKLQIGYWGMELAKELVSRHAMPVCIINGAVGGTRIDQHQRNPADPEDAGTIYGRLLWRVRQARLENGIRAIFWHQGENDQGADGPTGGYGWENYRQFFFDLAAAWKEDYPNVRHYYVFQIWPRACAMGVNGSDNMLREVQRTLSTGFSDLSVMSTLGIKPPGGCHYPPEGYAAMAHLILPLVERDTFGEKPAKSITPPDLKRAYWASSKRDAVALEFDQPVVWSDALVSQFYLDGAAGAVASGSVKGKVLMLKLKQPSEAKRITYLDSKAWSPDNLLLGENGIAALTFCNVPIAGQGAGGAKKR